MADAPTRPPAPSRGFLPMEPLPPILAALELRLRNSPEFKKAERKVAWAKANPEKARAARVKKINRLMAQEDREANRKMKDAQERARLAKE
jgi:hypothetical protein